MFVVVIAMRMMAVPIVQIVDVSVMFDGFVPAIGAVGVVGMFMCFVFSHACHRNEPMHELQCIH